jgi:hypothetical protein
MDRVRENNTIMKLNPTYLSGALVAIILLLLLPVPSIPPSLHIILGVVALLLAAGLFVVLMFLEKQAGVAGGKKAPEEPSRPVGGSAAARGSAEAEVIAFLGRMQEKGRLVDFLMDDISGYKDEEVGQAARVVYEGCRTVLKEHFAVEPLHGSAEGSRVTVPQGYRSADYQLSGRLTGEAPFQGTLVHRGWKVTSARLPKVIAGEEGCLPNLAPAQVEI